MNHRDHVELLRNGVLARGGVWADLGAGGGAFTLALAELIGASGMIYAVDRDRAALERLRRAMQAQYPGVTLHPAVGDFTRPLELPPLDGIVMANSLHFVQEQQRVLTLIRSYLKRAGRLLVVEYNTDRGNQWVPYPASFESWKRLAEQCGFNHTELLATRPSSFLGEFYAAASWRSETDSNSTGINARGRQ